MDGGSVTEFTDYGVSVGSAVKSASLARVTITGQGGIGSYGVYAEGKEGMTLKLDDVKISRVQTGVYAEKGIFKMDGGSVTKFTGYGVSVGDKVTSASLARVTIEGKGSEDSYGVYAVGAESLMMTLDDVRISNVAMGVSVEKAKSLMMTGGSVTDFADYGVDVGENVKSAELKGVEIEGKNSGTGTGVYAKV
ncbi:hypothetical protein m07a_01900 [Bartonella schoenbuchensis m07a]|uniref:Uncharacterized protein n=2 Tax=Bartonella schoenbuchensis TaxID=165694 RepID=N6UJT7_9HYPH|nr:hypothetical protein m07a_01900 [Bartonella schoenbuchensis m07a]